MIKKTAYTLLLWLAAFAAKAQLHDSTTVPIVGFEYVEQLMQQKKRHHVCNKLLGHVVRPLYQRTPPF
ncbi:hypothetical protein QQ054_24015 [Oscillatoria amoena NRMC-F 0135]|nr:hypothetical protein [Oscillatoria amoena NRMC-F 0135]